MSGVSPSPVLLITLDLSDPRLGVEAGIPELPLCSRLDGTIERQSYLFEPGRAAITYEGPSWYVPIDTADMLPSPLEQHDLLLRNYKDDEDPEHASKYVVQDTFLGGSACFRIRGQPIWLVDPEKVICSCGRETEFMTCIGYENYEHPSGIVAPTQPFFIGELALYFFVCFHCNRIVVVSQPS
jgi:hypothetical protein